ncbi:MAG: energy transducer TonB [Chlorobi bacterium]|nr:energy transducer TonB [Chlorobiota bacterium]
MRYHFLPTLYRKGIIRILAFAFLLQLTGCGSGGHLFRHRERERVRTKSERMEQQAFRDRQRVHKTVDVMPLYPGCENKTQSREEARKCLNRRLGRYLYRNLEREIFMKYLEPGDDMRIKISFVVDKKGKIRRIRTDSPYKDVDKEIKRVLKQVPQMKPATRKGKPVRIRFLLPLRFKMEE